MRDALAAVRAYHEATKHHTTGYAPSPGFLDWDSQPNPFRRFKGAPLIPLPLIDGRGKCTFDELFATSARKPDLCNLESIGLFLELSFGLSAWKSTGMDRWSLRNNPSSGNLHPTEAYLLLWASDDENLEPGLYHYAPHEHALEMRARLSPEAAQSIASSAPDTFGAIGLSSVIWREEWKYGARAYRYCQHDVGHALGAASFAAGVNGWSFALDPSPSDEDVEKCLGLNRSMDFQDAEAEHPDLLAILASRKGASPPSWQTVVDSLSDWEGSANCLSEERVAWPQIAEVLPAVCKARSARPANSETPAAENPEPIPATEADRTIDACSLIRQRRSAQRMDGQTGIARSDFDRMMARTLPSREGLPFNAFPYAPAINLLLFVHAVEGLDPGFYLLNRTPDRFEAFQKAARIDTTPVATEDQTKLSLPLFSLTKSQNLRKLASQISCYQGIGGRGAFSLGMIADFQNVLETDGAWAYRRLHWEAGLIGQVLYLEAEAAGLRGTGIGCFFDDAVHALLGLETKQQAPWQTLYHFTVGAAYEDNRLITEPAYAHLSDRKPTSRQTS